MMSSHKAFILAVSGAAIGIGSIWRMPYLIGENGGSLFICCYLFFILILGIPAMVAEILIGRIGRRPPAEALKIVSASGSGTSVHWSKIAILGTLASALILSFYCVVSGWGVHYLWMSLSGLQVGSVAKAEVIFNDFLGRPSLLLGYGTLFLIMTFGVSAFKVNNGIERLNDMLMPFLYTILIVLVIYAATLPGFTKALHYILHPNWSELKPSMLLTAMGMAFFTLATGACCLMAYGAYMPQTQSILFSVSVVAVINLVVTLCAGIAIFSIVFSYGMSASSGPGLIFMALPVALKDMPFGLLIMPVFFFLLLIACWTSSVNLAEPLVAALSHKMNSRLKGTCCSALIVWCLGLIPAFSFNILKNIKFFGQDLFSLYTGLATDIFLPVTGFLILLFTGRAMKQQYFIQQMNLNQFWGKFWYFLVKYVGPLGLLLIFLTNFVKA